MLYTSQITIGAMKHMSLTFGTIFQFFFSVDLLSEHVAMVKECMVKNSEVYRTLPGAVSFPLAQYLWRSSQQHCSAVAFVTPTGQKAVSLILAYLDLPINASYSLWLLDFAHYTLASSCIPLPWLIILTGFCAGTCTTVSIVFGTFKAPSGYLSGKTSTILDIFMFSLGYISIIKSDCLGCY